MIAKMSNSMNHSRNRTDKTSSKKCSEFILIFPVHLYFNKFFLPYPDRRVIHPFQFFNNSFSLFSLMLNLKKKPLYIIIPNHESKHQCCLPQIQNSHIFSSVLTFSSAIPKLAPQCAGPIDSLVSTAFTPISGREAALAFV